MENIENASEKKRLVGTELEMACPSGRVWNNPAVRWLLGDYIRNCFWRHQVIGCVPASPGNHSRES